MEWNIENTKPLTNDNLDAVYGLYSANEKFFKISIEDFENQTLRDNEYRPELSLVYYQPKSKKPIGIIMGVVKKGIILINLTVKVLFIDPKYRRQKLGTFLFYQLVKKAKPLLKVTSFVNYGFSPPQFLQPGVDVRHTSLLFFLQSMGLNQRNPRKNLTAPIPDDFKQPVSTKNGYTIRRVSPEYYESLLNFIKKEFVAPTWPKEVKLTFEKKQPSTFIALDVERKIVGFASYGTCFSNSFGPTGVSKSIRGKGIGGELLKWCLWDIKEKGFDKCTIMYVVGDTVKYYSKTVNAYIDNVFIPMNRSILYWWNVRK